MRILIVLSYNPFAVSGAAANRLRGILENVMRRAICEILVINSYRNRESNWGDSQCIIREYSHGFSGLNLFPDRFRNEWLGLFVSNRTKRVLQNHMKSFCPNIIWFERSMQVQRLLVASQKEMEDIYKFIEISEFHDIHKVQKTNIFRSVVEDVKMNFYLKQALPLYNGIGLMTTTLYEFYKRELIGAKQRILHLPMTVDLERFNAIGELPPEFSKPFIAYIGVMNNIKDGIDILIDAFAQIADEFPDYTLYLVGPFQPDTEGHFKQIKELGLSERVFWMKTYSRDVIPNIIGNSDLLVLPRPDSKQARGGFPTKLGEYLSTGVPVCATRVGEIPKYLSDNESVFFANPGSVLSFADSMRRALSSKDRGKRVGHNGRKVAEKNFNAQIQAERLLMFFDEQIKLGIQ